jgi:hypothetical protein
MRLLVPLFCAAIAVAGLACSGKSSASGDDPKALGAVSSDDAGRKRAAAGGGSNIPKDAQWTILCRSVTGIDHVGRARQWKEALQKTPGLKDWYLVHKEDESLIYYGYYRSFNDPKDAKETARAQRDRKQIDALTDSMGNRPFSRAIFVALSAPDPGGPPEWNLVNATGHWSLQVAAYKDHPDRKAAAVEAVRAAREMGVDAYYHHGETTSSVCVGAWPRGAVTETVDSGGEQAKPDDAIFVLPTGVAPEKLPDHMVKVGPDGERARAVTNRITVHDAGLAAAMKQYPHHAVNGTVMVNRHHDPKTGKVKEVLDPSFLIEIPHGQPSALDDGSALTGGTASPADPGTSDAAPATPVAPQRQQPGAGRLRSIGGN